MDFIYKDTRTKFLLRAIVVIIAFLFIFPIKSSMTCGEYSCTINERAIFLAKESKSIDISTIDSFKVISKPSSGRIHRTHHYIYVYYKNGDKDRLFTKIISFDNTSKICKKLNMLLQNEELAGFSIKI